MRFSALLSVLSGLLGLASAISVTSQNRYDLGVDPEGSARLNGMSFQQDVITTYRGWQYVAFYNSTMTYNSNNVVLARRPSSSTNWQYIRFTDYVQKTMDSHNTISLGISGDGRIHLSYDHHDVPLNYRVSHSGIANDPNNSGWHTGLFSGNQRSLPNGGNGPWGPLTYPRFERVSNGDLLFEFRIGASGSGDSYIYLYSSNSKTWTRQSKYLQGNNNNAYINGLDYVPQTNRLHASWTWRETPDVVTNHDLGYAYSEDLGRTWKNSNNQGLGGTITPNSQGIHVFGIGQRSGILNQEGQTADRQGRVHVLNRENVNGRLTWMHYWRETNGQWTRNTLPHSLPALTQTGKRGSLISDSAGNLFAILAGNTGTDMIVTYSTPGGQFRDWSEIWRSSGWDTEPLVDRNLFRDGDGKVLSIFGCTQGGFPTRRLRVVDLVLGN
ncbi:hypothetical protein BJ508DRAFT_411505 [Ascobolus immersus RN42]|uniref:Dockerin type 1 n=1 Tax=Ascobolus immersus RN42 TaxID=1160509 RepID=A0A3N4ILP6_ASCIM|nr:hypothetical protein BJ508DRAFT_411505 [Ascobolus immersus RN42]